MAHGRFVHLIALVLLGACAVVLRLWQVQVGEHEVWANEAANLVRSGQILPFTRGPILDDRGRSIVRDQELYRIDFVYRDFRRGHALGQVAHARTTLTLRAVALPEALASLETWAADLVRLSPADLGRWADGGPLELGALALSPSPDPGREHRRSRARDVGFYAARLFGLSRAEGRDMHRAMTEWKEEQSFLELVASWRAHTPARVERELMEGLDQARVDLAGLARLLTDGDSPRPPLEELLSDLESCRRRVEDGTASRLFREATGFRPGRVEDALLFDAVDLEWIAVRLRWDAERTRAWLADARRGWLAWRDTTAIEAIAAELALAPPGPVRVDVLLDQLAAVYREPDPRRAVGWRESAPVRALGHLAQLFEGARVDPALLAPETLQPVADPAIRDLPLAADQAWDRLAYVELWRDGVERAPLELRAQARDRARVWRDAAGTEHVRTDALAGVLLPELERWERRYQDALRAAFTRLWEQAQRSGELAPPGRLRLREESLDRATERAAYIRRDLGSREQRIARDPDYEVVHLLSRYPDRFAGFLVQNIHVRVQEALDASGRPLLDRLVGRVRQSDVRELRAQREEADELTQLLALGTRTDSEDARLGELVGSVYRPEQIRGAEGLEALLDASLSGHNGYEERRGLQDKSEPRFRDRRWSVEPVDGRPAVLTLDLDLQRAARHCLEHPAREPRPDQPVDTDWLARPVGAIVLATVDGDVLAAESMPVAEPEGFLGPDANGDGSRPPQWALPLERTLRKPTFQPPGSVFKPFVAAWALEHHGWEPGFLHTCNFSPEAGGAGYKNLRCWRSIGHDEVDLRGALKGSCNAYFARMGESLGPLEFVAVLREFGFGQPSGVNDLGGGERAGIPEHAIGDVVRELPRRMSTERTRLQAANGLAVIEANPMQIARATCALATGRLPRMRLVREVGGREVPHASRPLSIQAETLDVVRSALVAVAGEDGGTAYVAFEDFDVPVAAKTGSADLSARNDAGLGRKHTWFTGWLPATDPELVLVVFCHDTTVTSSHSAIWIARQFLDRPEVRAHLEARGIVR